VADSRQEVVLKHGGCARGYQILSVKKKKSFLRNVTEGVGLGRLL